MAASDLHNRTNIHNVNIDNDDCNIFCNDLVELYHYDTFSDLNFAYYTSDTFSLKIAKKSRIELSLFHMNIRNLNKNDELQELLSTIDHDFDIIVLSEICFL